MQYRNRLKRPPRILVVGGGLTGCTVAHRLACHGLQSVVLERAPVPGGLIRSAHLDGILYEPHGSHIFHTEDEEVWSLATSLTPFHEYRHRVAIVIEGKVLNWPILISDIDAQSRSAEIKAQLTERRLVDPAARAEAANFEEWCIELMGPLLYDRYIKPYTEKQWGRAPRELSARWAPARVSVRWDNNPYLFSDPHQGWPSGTNGYTDLIDGLLAQKLITLRPNNDVTLANLQRCLDENDADGVVFTCPLDVFCDYRLGALAWRGILVRSVSVPHVEYAQSAMVTNYPGLEYPFIRIHETKHASGQTCPGTVLGLEFTNAPTRYYPIDTDENVALNLQYQSFLRETVGADRTFFAGRLANYTYIDMDDCMRQALDCADDVAGVLRDPASVPTRR